MKAAEREVRALGARLESDVLALGGRLPAPAPDFRVQLLLPVGVLAGVGLLLALHPAIRRSALASLAVRITVATLQTLAAGHRDLP